MRGLQVGQQVIDVVRRALAPLLFQDTIFQHLDAVLGLNATVQHLLHIPDGCRQSGVGCRVPQTPLHHAAALLQQDGHLALDTVLQEAPALNGGIQFHALDLGRQRRLVHRNGVIVFHGGPLVTQQLHACLVDQVRGIAAEEILHVLAPGPVVVGHGLLHGLDHGVGHGVSRAVRQHPNLHGLALLVSLLNVAPVVLLRIRDRQATVQQVLPAVGVLQVHVQAAQLGVGQRCSPTLAVLQANVHQLRARTGEFFHLSQVCLARHIVKELRSLHSDPGLFPLAVIQHGAQLLHLSARLVAAQHPEHTASPQHIQVVSGQGALQLSIVALALAHLCSRLVGDLVHRFGFLQAQGLVCRPDHVQGAGRNGFQHPHLVHRHGQIGAVLCLPDPLSQPVTQHLGLFAVRQCLGLCQLLVQPVKLGLLAGIQVSLQRVDELRHLAQLPVLADAVGAVLGSHRLHDAGAQGRQPGHGVVVQQGHIRQLCHLCRLLDQVGLHIPVLAGPQDHLVQLGSIGPDAPPQLVLLPTVPGFLYPLLSQLLGNGNVLVPLLLGCSDGDCVSLRLLFLPLLSFALVFLLPFQQFVFLMDQLPLGSVSPALFSCHLVRKVPVLPLQLFVFQPDLVQHLLAFFLQPLLFGLPLPFVGFLQHVQLFGHVAVVGDVQPQRIQILIQQLFCFFIPLLLFCPLPQCFIPASVPAVLIHPPVELPVLLLLHLPQVLQRLLRVLLAHGSSHSLALPALEPIKDGLCIGHLRHVQDITQHPVGQLHFCILVLGSICKAAHHPGLDGIVHVHQHIQPLGALHAGRAVHACRLGRAPEQGRCPFLSAAHGPGVVDDGFIHFRRVAVPHTLCLPQLHAVLPGLGHRFTPRPVPFHQLRLGRAVLVHRVAQVVVFRVLVPQLGVPVGGPAQYFICNGLRQRAGLAHAGPVRRHVLHQRPGLSGNLRPVGPAAVGLCPPHRQPVNGILADPHTVGHTHHLGQRFHCRAVVRNGPARLPLGVLPRVPFRLFGFGRQLVPESCQAALCGQLTGLVIVPDLPHNTVSINAAAVLLAGCNPAVGGGNIQRELSLFTAQASHHLTDLFQLCSGRGFVCGQVNTRSFRHHPHITVCQELVQCVRPFRYFRRTEHTHNFPVVGVTGLIIPGKIQHLPIRQDVSGPFKFTRRAKLLHGQLTAILRRTACFLCFGIIDSLLFLLLFISLGFQLGMGFPQCIIHFTDSVFKLCTTLVKVLPLCKVRLVFFTGLKLLCLGREQTQRFSLRFNLLYLGAVQPVCSLCFQGVLLVFQFPTFFLKCRQFIHVSSRAVTQLEPHRFLHRFAVSLAFGIFLCYTVFNRKARAFTALLGFEYRVSAFLINRTLRPSAPRIFGFHVGFAGGFRKTSLQTTP